MNLADNKKRFSKKLSKSVKLVKRSSKKASKKMVGGKKKSKKSKCSHSCELPPGLVAHQEFVKFLQKDMDIKGGVLVNMLAAVYKNIAKKNNPDVTDSVKLAEKAKKVYMEEKSSGQPHKRYKELESSRAKK